MKLPFGKTTLLRFGIFPVIGLLSFFILLGLSGTLYYHGSSGEQVCARCHEIKPTVDIWRSSSHRSLSCSSCHGSAMTLDVSFHLNNLNRVVQHWREEVPERIRLRQKDLDSMQERCQSCHRQEYAQWMSGPHAASYKAIFTEPTHNRKRRLVDDCLRCHGMFFPGGIQDLVNPSDLQGPWKLAVPELADRPAIPCLACHRIHRQGDPLPMGNPRERRSRKAEEVHRPSLSLFYRREMDYVSVDTLPLPGMRQGARLVRMSPDPRQALCYQCHAPLDTMQVGSGDDRTGTGVHEGIGCPACHQKHGQRTRASCADCHPRLSNCNRDVEKMDTTFFDPKSPNNIHFVTCPDCHKHGVPSRKSDLPSSPSPMRSTE